MAESGKSCNIDGILEYMGWKPDNLLSDIVEIQSRYVEDEQKHEENAFIEAQDEKWPKSR